MPLQVSNNYRHAWHYIKGWRGPKRMPVELILVLQPISNQEAIWWYSHITTNSNLKKKKRRRSNIRRIKQDSLVVPSASLQSRGETVGADVVAKDEHNVPGKNQTASIHIKWCQSGKNRQTLERKSRHLDDLIFAHSNMIFFQHVHTTVWLFARSFSQSPG